MPLVGRMNSVGINQVDGTLGVGVVYRVERFARVRNDERILVSLHSEHRVQRAVESGDEAFAEFVQPIERNFMSRRQRVARFLLDERSVDVHYGIVDRLKNYRRVGIELFQPVNDVFDVLDGPRGRHTFTVGVAVQHAVDAGVIVLRRFHNDFVHRDVVLFVRERPVLPVLQHIVAEYGNVDDVRLLHVQDEPSRTVIAEVVVEQREQILGQVSGNGMVVILEIVPAAEHVRVGVFVSEPERRRAEYALRNGIAQIDDLRLFGGFTVVITGCERRRAACEQHDAQHGRDDLLLHDSPPYHPPLRPLRRGFRPYYTTPRTRIQSSIPGVLSFNGSLFRPDVRRGSSVTRSPPDVRRRYVPPRRPAPSPLPSRQPSCRRP